MRFITCTTSTAVGVFGVIPIAVYVVNKELIPLIPIKIIFCDHSYTLTIIVQTFMGGYSVYSTIIYGAVMIFCISNYILQMDLIGEDFQELDRMWKRGNDVSIAYKHAFLKNLCKKRQDINKYAFEMIVE